MTEQEKKEQAMARALSGVTKDWRAWFIDTALQLALDHPFITTDDIWDAGVPKPADVGVGDNRASGPLMILMAKANIIERTGETRKSSRRHHGDVRVWKSLVFEDG